jgi:hypothetical protein
MIQSSGEQKQGITGAIAPPVLCSAVERQGSQQACACTVAEWDRKDSDYLVTIYMPSMQQFYPDPVFKDDGSAALAAGGGGGASRAVALDPFRLTSTVTARHLAPPRPPPPLALVNERQPLRTPHHRICRTRGHRTCGSAASPPKGHHCHRWDWVGEPRRRR